MVPSRRTLGVGRPRSLTRAALQVGCAERGLDMTVGYTEQREQFGRPIGSFQALEHRMADMLVRRQMSRSGAWAAVQAHVHDTLNVDRLTAAAASNCAESAMTIASEMIQLHGGHRHMKHDGHLVLKCAQALDQLFEVPHQQRAALISCRLQRSAVSPDTRNGPARLRALSTPIVLVRCKMDGC